MMFEIPSGVPSEASLQFSPQVSAYGRGRSVILSFLLGSMLFGGVVLAVLALYSGVELLASGAQEGAASLFATSLRASALVSTLCAFGFLATLIALRGAWERVGLSAQVASSFLAAIAVLLVLGLNTRGPIAYAVGAEAESFWPLGLVILSLGMSMALFALKLGQVVSEALSPLDLWAKEEARRARPYRFAASLVQAVRRPSTHARSRFARNREKRAKSLAQAQLPIGVPDCGRGDQEGSESASKRWTAKISKAKRAPRRVRPVQDPSLQGNLFRAR